MHDGRIGPKSVTNKPKSIDKIISKRRLAHNNPDYDYLRVVLIT